MCFACQQLISMLLYVYRFLRCSTYSQCVDRTIYYYLGILFISVDNTPYHLVVRDWILEPTCLYAGSKLVEYTHRHHRISNKVLYFWSCSLSSFFCRLEYTGKRFLSHYPAISLRRTHFGRNVDCRFFIIAGFDRTFHDFERPHCLCVGSGPDHRTTTPTDLAFFPQWRSPIHVDRVSLLADDFLQEHPALCICCTGCLRVYSTLQHPPGRHDEKSEPLTIKFPEKIACAFIFMESEVK